jgi:hypothetical protein
MASLRKRHQSHADSDAPISTPPPAAEPTSTQSPAPLPEEIKTESPADVAAKNALRDRLQEMENAQRINQQRPEQHEPAAAPMEINDEPQRPTAEQIIATSGLPERAKNWLRQHPEYITDKDKNDLLLKMHYVAEHQAGGEYTDPYFERMDELLGHKQPKPNGDGAASTRRLPVQHRQPAPRQQAPAVSYSAPPHRDVPTMRTGRSPSVRTPLSADELEVARSSGMTPEQYAEAKRMLTEQERIGPRARDGR